MYYTEKQTEDAFKKGTRSGSNAGMSVSRGGEMNLVSFEEWKEQNPPQEVWKYTEKELPLAYQEGDWDGKRSDVVVVEIDLGLRFTARLYEGTLDGSKFSDWVNEVDEAHMTNRVIKWMYLPE